MTVGLSNSILISGHILLKFNIVLVFVKTYPQARFAYLDSTQKIINEWWINNFFVHDGLLSTSQFCSTRNVSKINIQNWEKSIIKGFSMWKSVCSHQIMKLYDYVKRFGQYQYFSLNSVNKPRIGLSPLELAFYWLVVERHKIWDSDYRQFIISTIPSCDFNTITVWCNMGLFILGHYIFVNSSVKDLPKIRLNCIH